MEATQKAHLILKENRNGILLLTINRPKRANALSRETISQLINSLIEGDKEPTVRAIVLTGSGQQHFCAGMDLKEVVDEGNKQYPHPMKDVHRNLHEVLLEVGKPTIAAINGAAVGGGSELSLACDLRIAVEDSYFSQPEVKVGMGANFASVILPLLIPRAIAFELLYTGRKMSSQEALHYGLINKVFPKDTFHEQLWGYVESITANAPLSLRKIKETALKSWGQSPFSGLRLNVGPDCYISEDRAEGTKAFLERRAPQFKGK